MSSDPVDSFVPQTLPLFIVQHLSSGGRTPSALGGTGLESVLELAGNGAEVPHAAGTDGLPSLGLVGPVVCFPSCQRSTNKRLLPRLVLSGNHGGEHTAPGLGGRVSAASAGVSLVVHGPATAPAADAVGLGVAISTSLAFPGKIENRVACRRDQVSFWDRS